MVCGITRTPIKFITAIAIIALGTLCAQGVAAPTGTRAALDEVRELERTVKERANGDEISVGLFWDAPRAFMALKDEVVSQRDPDAASTHYLGVTVQCQADRRVVPLASVQVSWKGSSKDASETQTLPFVWSPKFNHYGANVTLAKETTSVVVTVVAQPPTFMRGEVTPEPFFSKTETLEIRSAVPASEKPRPTSRKTPVPSPVAGTPRPLDGRYKRLAPTPYPGSETTATVTPVPTRKPRRAERATTVTATPIPNYLLPR